MYYDKSTWWYGVELSSWRFAHQLLYTEGLFLVHRRWRPVPHRVPVGHRMLKVEGFALHNSTVL